MSDAVSDMFPRISYRARHSDERLVLKVIAAENANCVERFQRDVLLGPLHGVRKIERHHDWRVIRRLQTNHLRMPRSRLRQQITVGVNQVSDLHSVAVRIFARMEYMPVEIHRLVGVGKNR